MKIYIVRHGETDWNNLGLIQGRIDNPLNQTGRDQAHNQIGTFFVDKHIDSFITTSLSRARETLEIIMKNNNLEGDIIINDNFIERNFGELEGAHIDEFYNHQDISTIIDYENDQQIETRAFNGLIEVTHMDVNNPLIVCHSHTMKALLHKLFPGEYSYDYKLANCAIICLSFSDNEFALEYIK